MSEPKFNLYVANTSLQHHKLVFSLEKPPKKIYEQDIPIGAQIRVLDRGLTREELDFFIAQKEIYGFRNVTDKSTRGFVGICYSVGSEVRVDTMAENFEQNQGALEDQQEERITNATASIADLLQKKVGGAPTPLLRASVEVIEESDTSVPGRNQVASGAEYIAEGVTPHNRGRQRRAAGGRR